jgi:cyclophilin family peptidyl-prolyl cis-trans isomerase
MRQRRRLSEAPCWRVCAAALCLGLAPLAAQANQFVKLDYNLTLASRSRDTVFIELFDDKPITRDNFMAYVNGDKYDGMMMHRLSHGFVMQGGGFYPQYQSEPTLSDVPYSLKSSPDVQVDLDGNSATPNPEIVNEYSVGTTRSNVRGRLAMARRGGEPNSASSEWFVNYKNNSFLDSVDGGFTVFGVFRGDSMAYYDALDVLSTSVPPALPNGMLIVDLNQDANNDGVRDDGAFWNGTNDGVPLLFGFLSNLVIVQNAERIDYYGNTGSSTTLNFPVGGLTISTRDVFIDTGTAFLGTGGLTIGAGRTLGTREGIFLNRNVNNLGTLAPGLSNAAITLPSYQQGAGGKLAIDIRGTAVDTHYDRLAVSGSAQLSGTLDVDFLNQYFPKGGDAFAVLTASSISGNFTSYDLPALYPSAHWIIDKTSTAITLRVVGGDYDENGKVELADYNLWKSTFGTAGASFAGADGNGDGIVNAADYTIWRNFLGTVTPPGSGSGGVVADGVPEPSSIFLVMLASGAVVLIARRRELARG